MKMDYGNQNTRLNPGKDPFSFDADPETKPEIQQPVVKPKKFFKSRNVQPIVEDIRPDAAVYRQVPDSQYGRVRTPKQSVPKSPLPKTPPASVKKLSESSEGSGVGESLNREEGKPPIVLRICKGTARLVCNDVQEAPASEPDTYRISTPEPSPVDPEDDFRDSSLELSPKPDLKSRETRSSHQPVVTTVSIPLENSEMRRTTRSRAKNLQLDLSSPSTAVPTPTTPNSHSSGLSLTLRKSVTDSNNTLISHYDIVKTDCNPNYPVKSTIEPLIGHDQPLPTTTQELIDILSSDADPLLSRPEPISKTSEQEQSSENITDEVQHCSIDLPTDEHISETELEPDLPAPVVESEPQAAKAMVDQDWFSGSDDSEALGGNTENDPVNVASPASEPQPTVPVTSIATKPVTKKGSIFKSRSTGAASGNKRLALYKHKWCDNDKESSTADAASTGTVPNEPSASHGNSAPVAFEEEEFEPSKLTRVVSYPETDMDFTDETEAITSIRCGKKVKGVSYSLYLREN